VGRDNVHISPSDYETWLDDIGDYARLKVGTHGDGPLIPEYKLDMRASSNLAGLTLYATTFPKLAIERQFIGSINFVSNDLMKSPHLQSRYREVRKEIGSFLAFSVSERK
jgi:myo-inositol-1-phosphate synthase